MGPFPFAGGSVSISAQRRDATHGVLAPGQPKHGSAARQNIRPEFSVAFCHTANWVMGCHYVEAHDPDSRPDYISRVIKSQTFF